MQQQNLRKVILFSLLLSTVCGHTWAANTEFHKETTGNYEYKGNQIVDSLYQNAYNEVAGRADAAISGSGSGVRMNFDGDVSVSLGNNNAIANESHGLGAYKGAKITLGGGKLLINNSTAHTANGNHGLVANSDSMITVDSNTTEINISGSSGTSSGITAYQNGKIKVANDLSINVNEGYYNSGITAKDSSLVETGNAKIVVTAGNANSYALGVLLSGAAGFRASGALDITTKTTAAGSQSIGMDIRGNSSAAVENVKMNIENTGSSGKAYGLKVDSLGSYIGKSLDINISGNDSIYGIINNGQVALEDLKINIKGNYGTVTGIDNIKSLSVKNVYMTIDNSNSSLDTTGFKSNGNSTVFDGDVKMLVKGGGNAFGLNGSTVINGNADIIVFSGESRNSSAAQLVELNGKANNLFLYLKEGGGSVVEYGLTANDGVTNVVLETDQQGVVTSGGIQGIMGFSVNLKNSSVLNVRVDASSIKAVQGSSVYGMDIHDGYFDKDTQTNIVVSGPAVDDNGNFGTVGILGRIKAEGDVNIQVLSEKGIAIKVRDFQKSNYSGDLIINTNNGWAVAMVGSDATYPAEIIINPDIGKKVQLNGDIAHFDTAPERAGIIDISFKMADSFLNGASTGLDEASKRATNLAFDNGACWNISGDSGVSKLTVNNDSIIDLTHGANLLNIDNYNGDKANFILDTDLNSEINGDKIKIKNAGSGTTYIQVKDVSLINGDWVTGAKKLLLVTDESKNATFVGKNINAGGLWDVMPTIENGLQVTDGNGNVIGTEAQWYLTKLSRTVNNDTTALLGGSENTYALWRNTNDSLRNRLGELHYSRDRKSNDGLWARTTAGKFTSIGSDSSSYNLYQLGYDKSYHSNSSYGFAIESGSAKAGYKHGSGDSNITALSLYGSWQGSSGSYTDLVAKIGWMNTDFKSYGDYPDQADYSGRSYSLSVEHGKKIILSEQSGSFVEPQVQLIMGRIGSSKYTTKRGTQAEMSAINSFIGRLGFLLGQKIKNGNEVYVKASLLHEFGGRRDINLHAANGERLNTTHNYGDTWFEVGVGANVKLSKTSNLYFDIERSLGASIQKKWQINAGLRAEF